MKMLIWIVNRKKIGLYINRWWKIMNSFMIVYRRLLIYFINSMNRIRGDDGNGKFEFYEINLFKFLKIR